MVRLGKQPASVIDIDRKLREWGNPYGEILRALPRMTQRVARWGYTSARRRNSCNRKPSPRRRKLLGATGMDPTLLSAGRSSGYLPYALGLWDVARDLARQTVDEIVASGVREVITLTAEDAHAIKHVYYELGLMPPPQVRVTQMAEYLAPQVASGELKIRPLELQAATYHDPCHAHALPDHAKAARQLIAALTGSAPREMLWREQRAAPCGATGGLEFTQPKLAAAMAQKRLEGARDIGAEIVLTDDPHWCRIWYSMRMACACRT